MNAVVSWGEAMAERHRGHPGMLVMLYFLMQGHMDVDSLKNLTELYTQDLSIFVHISYTSLLFH